MHLVNWKGSFMSNSANIPTIESISTMTNEVLDRFIRDGFAYVKIPNQLAENKLDKLDKEAVAFFKLPKDKKEETRLDPITLKGYVDRRKEEGKTACLEQMTFPIDSPVGPFANFKADIDVVSNTYRYEIVKPLLRAIFYRILKPLDFASEEIDKLLSEATDEIFTPMSLLCYPYTKNPEKDLALPEHVDEDMITVLWVAQEGLQVWLEPESSICGLLNDKVRGDWYDINPKTGYVVVNIGKALSWMLGKRCNAIKHRVLLPKKDRLSIGVFYNPPITYKMRDIVENKLLFNGSYSEYLKDHFSETSNDTFYGVIEQQETATV